VKTLVVGSGFSEKEKAQIKALEKMLLASGHDESDAEIILRKLEALEERSKPVTSLVLEMMPEVDYSPPPEGWGKSPTPEQRQQWRRNNKHTFRK